MNHLEFEYVHMVGDFTFIQSTDSFKAFQPGTKIVLPIVREYWYVQETDNMPVMWFELCAMLTMLCAPAHPMYIAASFLIHYCYCIT